MKKSVKKGIGLVGILALSLFGGVMTSYAIGPGEVNQTVAKPVTYNQQSARALGNWEQQGNTWKFKCLDGSYLTNSWVESLSEAGAFYYVDNNGSMLVNSKTPDGYNVDGSGLWRSGVNTTGSTVTESSSVSNTVSRAETGKTTGRTEERLTQEYMDFVKEHTKGYTPGANLN